VTAPSRFNVFNLLGAGKTEGESAAMRSAKIQRMASINFPFKAPVYRSYPEALDGCYRQGLGGFYKGNGIRSLHIVLFHRLNTDFAGMMETYFPAETKQI